jgi:uncharacterized protein YdeI (YjbR/CyaY-like superfamily)
VPDDLPLLAFATPAEFQRWLAKNHAKAQGLWLKIAKKDSRHTTVLYPEALEIALCYGWIDGQKGAFDEHFYKQRFTPRRARSKWSQVNVAKAEELIAQERMKPPGSAEVERAKADGRWDAAYPSQSRATVPPDLQRELDKNPKASEFFATLNSVNRYAFLYRLHNVTDPKKRAERIKNYIDLLIAKQTLL